MRFTAVVLLLLAGAFSALPVASHAADEEEKQWKPPKNVLLLSGEKRRPPKYIPLGKTGDAYLSFGGEYRLACEQYDPADMGLSDVGRGGGRRAGDAAHRSRGAVSTACPV